MATTIRDIADMAGVSTATVSRVIHKNGFVKDDTRELISSLMEKHNYIPKEPIKRRFGRSASSSMLKYGNFTMVWNGGAHVFSNYTAQAIMVGLSEAATTVGVSLNVHTMGEELDSPGARGTDGIFLNGSRFPKAFMDKVSSFPVVWLLQSGSHEFGDRIQPDHHQVGLISYEYFREKGCLNLCCVTCRDKRKNPPYWQSREEAFCNAAAAEGIKCRVINLDFDDNIESSMQIQADAAEEAVNRMLSGGNRPDGIFIANTLGAPVYAELVSRGLIPSQNIEMIAGDKEICRGYFNPEPVLIDINSKSIGELAIETMLLRMHNPNMPQMTHMLKPSLIVPGAH